MSVPNSVFADLVTTLMVHVLIDGKDILPDVFWNEDIAKGVLIGGTHVEPRSLHGLNETTFLVAYSSGILAEEIRSTNEKIDDWLGKPMVITCDEVTTAQSPQVIKCACHTMGVESVVFITRIDNMQSDSNQNIQSGYHSYVGRPAVLGHQAPLFWTKYLVYHIFLVQNEKRTLSGLNGGFMPSLMPERASMSN